MALYEHNCPYCTSLGPVLDGGKHYDLYYCESGEPHVSARYADGPTMVIKQNLQDIEGTVTRKAVQKAMERGLIKT